MVRHPFHHRQYRSKYLGCGRRPKKAGRGYDVLAFSNSPNLMHVVAGLFRRTRVFSLVHFI